jgi:hypothetical protein
VQGLRSVLIATVVLGFTPGVGELIRDGVHLLVEGYSAHDGDAHHEHGDDHGGAGTEHGCSGSHHTCGCCVSLTFLAAAELHLPPAPSETTRLLLDALARGPEGIERGLDRPPAA